VLAHAVRGRSSQLFGPTVWHGDTHRKAIALTFDDGPSESTPALLGLLREFGAQATLFQCGVNVRRLPEIAREVHRAGHEIGNHSDSHLMTCFRSAGEIDRDFGRAQETIAETLGVQPELVRPPFGVRWFGYRAMQQRLRLLNVMWTVMGRDWRLPAVEVADRVLAAAGTGGIVCLHDGRECNPKPDIRETLEALKRICPALLERGYHFETVSQILCPTP
jgi:peptidoglycan/xylan/chitin deacetylase (PgdA/CDA1 family)